MAANDFIIGINYPWRDYGFDFGVKPRSRRPEDKTLGPETRGLEDAETYAKVKNDFKIFKENNIKYVRWFVFCDGRSGIVFDKDNVPQGLQETARGCVSKALELAKEYDIFLILVLLDHTWSYARYTFDDRVLASGEHPTNFGRGFVLKDEWRRKKLQEILSDFFDYISKTEHSKLYAIEFMNEPEILIEGQARQDKKQHDNYLFRNPDKKKGDPPNKCWFEYVPDDVSFKDHSDLLKLARYIGDAVRASMPTTKFTVGSLRPSLAINWLEALGPEDFLQIHYYPDELPKDEMDLLKTGIPGLKERWSSKLGNRALPRVIIGEFPAKLQNMSKVSENVARAQKLGYGGVWIWSFNAADKYKATREDLTLLKERTRSR